MCFSETAKSGESPQSILLLSSAPAQASSSRRGSIQFINCTEVRAIVAARAKGYPQPDRCSLDVSRPFYREADAAEMPMGSGLLPPVGRQHCLRIKPCIAGFRLGAKARFCDERWVVERFFAWVQWQRRILVRWEYYPQNFLGFVQLACLLILFKRF
jgi:transposase